MNKCRRIRVAVEIRGVRLPLSIRLLMFPIMVLVDQSKIVLYVKKTAHAVTSMTT